MWGQGVVPEDAVEEGFEVETALVDEGGGEVVVQFPRGEVRAVQLWQAVVLTQLKGRGRIKLRTKGLK